MHRSIGVDRTRLWSDHKGRGKSYGNHTLCRRVSGNSGILSDREKGRSETSSSLKVDSGPSFNCDAPRGSRLGKYILYLQNARSNGKKPLAALFEGAALI